MAGWMVDFNLSQRCWIWEDQKLAPPPLKFTKFFMNVVACSLQQGSSLWGWRASHLSPSHFKTSFVHLGAVIPSCCFLWLGYLEQRVAAFLRLSFWVLLWGAACCVASFLHFKRVWLVQLVVGIDCRGTGIRCVCLVLIWSWIEFRPLCKSLDWTSLCALTVLTL